MALNKGGGDFQAPVPVFSGIYPAFAIGDINGDGKLDLIASGGVAGTRGRGGQLAGGERQWNVSGCPSPSANSDVPINVDCWSKTSTATASRTWCSRTRMRMRAFLAGYGDGIFSAETPFVSADEPTLLLTTDLNGDRKPDLIVGGLTMSVLLNKSAKTAQAAVASAAPAISTSVAPGSLASAYGTDLANKKAGGTSLPLPTSFGGTTVSILDASGNVTPLLCCTSFRRR